MFGAGGVYRGSSILISGKAGTGKTSIASHFVEAACRRGERCIYFGFEESPEQIIRNMRSIGIDLAPWVDSGLLRFEAARPSLFRLEMHLARMQRDIDAMATLGRGPRPDFRLRGDPTDLHATLLRMIDLLKSRSITAVATNLLSGDHVVDSTELACPR